MRKTKIRLHRRKLESVELRRIREDDEFENLKVVTTTYSTDLRWCLLRRCDCQTTCGQPSYDSVSRFRSYLSRWLMWNRGSQRLPSSSPSSSCSPFVSQSKSDTPGVQKKKNHRNWKLNSASKYKQHLTDAKKLFDTSHCQKMWSHKITFYK